MADIVERATELYETRETGREPAACFYQRLAADYATDIDLDGLLKASRHPQHQGLRDLRP